MKAILFCRVSSKEQELEGYSLISQEKLLKSYAEKHSFENVKIFSISETASGKKQRDIFSQMMEFIRKNNIKIIVCEKVDRLTRNFKDAVMIDEWLEADEERQAHLVKDGLILHKNSRSQEKLNWGIRILFAKNYIDNLAEEVKKGQKEKLAQGWFPSHPKLGYKTTGEKGHKIHVLDENKAPLVRRAFELYATEEYSLEKLVGKMYQEGLRSSNGTKVVKSRLHSTLSDPFYIGKMVWNNEVYEGKHKSLVEIELFEKVQRTLRGKCTPKYSKHDYLFKGLIRCVGCGGLITWEVHSGINYGHCNHYHACSQKAWSKEKDVEEQLTKPLFDLQLRSTRITDWIRKALRESHRDEIEYNTSSISSLNQQLSQIEKRLDALYDDKLDGKINADFYQRKLKQYGDEKEKVTVSIRGHSRASTKYFELGINFFELSQRANEVYFKSSPERKRQLLRLVFDELVLNEGKLITSYTKPIKPLFLAVTATNSSKVENLPPSGLENFEQAEFAVIKGKSGAFGPARSTWLPKPSSKIIDISRLLPVIQDFNYMGMLKERWEEIKRLEPSLLKIAN